ncbi:MAG: ATP-binding cassette domain-containing protein [Pseudomonadota bacterium]
MRFEGVRLRQGNFTLDADLEIAAGATAVIGPSGAGKSTVLAALAGFLPPERGRILWQGRDITAIAPGARPVTTVFQDHNLFPHLTVAQNLGLGLRPDLRLNAAEQARVAQALDQVGLPGEDGKRPAALSGGQQSRAALARALLRDQPILVLDEPFAALGPAQRIAMIALVDRIVVAVGKTVVMVTHQPEDALALGGAAILVAEGRAAPPVPVDELLYDPPPVLREYLGDWRRGR